MTPALERRLSALEARSRRLSVLLATALLVHVVLLLGAATQAGATPKDPSEELTAHAFRLVGNKGAVLARLGADARGLPELELRDLAGKPRIRLRIDRGAEPILSLHDARGTPRATVAVDSVGNPHVILLDKGQKPRWHGAVSERGAASLVFIHIDGKMPAGIGLHADGKPWVLGVRGSGERGR